MLPMKRTQNWLPGIFNDLFDSEWMSRVNSSTPAVNIIETDKDYQVEVAAPGMKREDFKIKVNEENQLVISLEKKEERKEDQKEDHKEGKYLRREFHYTQFRQVLVLPDQIERDKIGAKMDKGILQINIPKNLEAQKEKKEMTIEVK